MRRTLAGSILGCVVLAVGLFTTSLVASAADGDLDNDWGTGGIAEAGPLTAGLLGILDVRANSVRIGADGKVIAVGFRMYDPGTSTPTVRMAVARFLPNGQLDPTCDGDGVWLDPDLTSYDTGQDLEILPDGSFVVIGQQANSSGLPEIFSFRFDAQCAPVTSYGSGGKVVYPIGAGAMPAATVRQPDGKIVVVGWEMFTLADDQDTRLLAFRIGTDGQIDTGFSPAGSGLYRDVDRPSQARGVVRSPDGSLRVAGFTRPGAHDLGLVVALDASGNLVPSFGNNGRRVVSQADDLVYAGIDRRADGRLVVSGRLTTGGSDQLVIQCLLADGTSDTACGTNGARTHADFGSMEGRDIHVTGDGRLVVMGRIVDPVTTEFFHFVGRFTSDGVLDGTFATAGYHVGTVIGQLMRIQLQSDGKIVGAGAHFPVTDSEFVVIRLDNTVITTTVAPSTTAPETLPSTTAIPATSLAPTTIAAERLPATGHGQSGLVALALLTSGVLLVATVRRRML